MATVKSFKANIFEKKRANAQNISFETLNHDQFTFINSDPNYQTKIIRTSALKLLTMTNLHLSTQIQIIKPNYPERISDRLTE